MLPFFGTIESRRIGIEACAKGHYWAREVGALGHDVRMRAPSYVKPGPRRRLLVGKKRKRPDAKVCDPDEGWCFALATGWRPNWRSAHAAILSEDDDLLAAWKLAKRRGDVLAR